MKLGEKQELFAKLLPLLLIKARLLNNEVRMGDTFRDPRAFGQYGTNTIVNFAGEAIGTAPYGDADSMHKLKLAVDLNLFNQEGDYLVDSLFHNKLGDWWEKQDSYCRWGGRFDDGNHYSLSHWGRA